MSCSNGRCPPPSVCNMRQLHAGDYDADSLAQLLHEASVPVMLRHPISPSAFSWRLQSMASLLALHGDDSIEGGVYRGFTEQDRVDVSLPLRGFFPALRNGSVPAESYLFLDVSEMALAGSSRPLGDLYGRVSLLRDRGYAYAPAAARGRPVLSAGGWGSGRPFHSHGPALNALAKHWFVRRPDATPGSGAVEVPRRPGEALAAGWEDGLWQCTQRAGDLLWVPNLLEHATHNYDDEVVALFHVINDLGETPLHAAARAGDVAAVSNLLRDSGGSHLHARSKRGVTPLIFASGAGHVAAMQPLIAAGANLSAATSNGGQALHAAVVGGHARAVELLLRHGAPAEVRDGQGETPRDLATRLGHVEIARALLGGAGVARSVEEDALLLSQPFIEEGVLLTSAASGRRVYLHRLAELFTARCGSGWWTRPRKRCLRSEVFLTRRGNSLQRVDSSTLSLGGTASLAVPLSTAPPAAEVALSLPAPLFRAPANERDEAMYRLLGEGKAANAAGDFAAACARFEAAYALSLRPGLLVSAANMRMKMSQVGTAAAMYRALLADRGLAPPEREMASQKLAEARMLLERKETCDHAAP